MTIIEMLSKEMEQEAETTRKMLSRVPNDKYSWKPHEKSMTIQHLATHIADIPSWVSMTLTTDELDFANNSHKEPVITNTDQLLEYFEQCYAEGKTALANAKEEQLEQLWTMRNGDQIHMVSTRGEVIRYPIARLCITGRS
jgi:uncharacterized damage-inducible protein DinB